MNLNKIYNFFEYLGASFVNLLIFRPFFSVKYAIQNLKEYFYSPVKYSIFLEKEWDASVSYVRPSTGAGLGVATL